MLNWETKSSNNREGHVQLTIKMPTNKNYFRWNNFRDDLKKIYYKFF